MKSNSKLSFFQTSVLQELGVSVYQALESIQVQQLPWLIDVCELLEISLDDCIFDSQYPHFDTDKAKLHLPEQTYEPELIFKRSVWNAIRVSVERSVLKHSL